MGATHQQACEIAAAAVVDIDHVLPELRRASGQALDNLAAAGHELGIDRSVLVSAALQAMQHAIVEALAATETPEDA